ncbi:hypothetical protein [Actinorugispora endophytica]|uniref:Uncharacterized protein n=1 Tax=Actinorugispora endophytica TaxID=1605990 RepID=A0A4R6V322_9ACTN|nr:hypothetical protein [Actinorugispora endophytica]TDQ52917.1 hypothetical protein EV190_10533 [Actinorugispora endophytica]
MEITCQLDQARNIVRRFVRVANPEELFGREGTGTPPTAVGPFDPYLCRRFTEGCQNATVLWAEFKQQGRRGSYASAL